MRYTVYNCMDHISLNPLVVARIIGLIKKGLNIVERYCSRDIHAVRFSGFSAMLDLSMGGCQAAK